jgi:nitroreductase
MNLVNAVYALGYAASWITEWYAYDRRVLTGLGVLPHERIAGFVHIGTPVRPVEERQRPALAEIVTRYET